MFTLESPANDDFQYGSFGGFFNWTMTYSLDRFVIPFKSWTSLYITT